MSEERRVAEGTRAPECRSYVCFYKTAEKSQLVCFWWVLLSFMLISVRKTSQFGLKWMFQSPQTCRWRVFESDLLSSSSSSFTSLSSPTFKSFNHNSSTFPNLRLFSSLLPLACFLPSPFVLSFHPVILLFLNFISFLSSSIHLSHTSQAVKNKYYPDVSHVEIPKQTVVARSAATSTCREATS